MQVLSNMEQACLQIKYCGFGRLSHRFFDRLSHLSKIANMEFYPTLTDILFMEKVKASSFAQIKKRNKTIISAIRTKLNKEEGSGIHFKSVILGLKYQEKA